MTKPPLFQCIDISKSYGGVHAVQSVSLTLEPKTIRGLIGPNGAGKSTFIDAVSGRSRGSGRVLLDGRDISALSPRERRLLGVARSFQRTSIFPAMTVGAQLELTAHKLGRDNLDQLVDMLGLGPVVDVMADEISYGQQRLVDLALALIGRPRVLLLDEPAAGLSVAESLVLAQHLKTICEEWAVGVLLVEHDMDLVFQICDSLTVLETGKLLTEGEPAQVRANPLVITAYLGSEA
jgi:branched-chain amino acid transport system ATP-binding protein